MLKGLLGYLTKDLCAQVLAGRFSLNRETMTRDTRAGGVGEGNHVLTPALAIYTVATVHAVATAVYTLFDVFGNRAALSPPPPPFRTV